MQEKLLAKNLLDFDQTIAKPLFENVDYPWEVFEKLSDFIIEMGQNLPEDKYDKIDDNIWVAKTAVVAPTAYLHGPLIICDHAEIRHCAFIRGCAIVGENSVVGNSTELKGSILFNCVQTPHYNYIGDSVLGFKSHTGAGVITSNLKSDKSPVTVLFEGDKLDTNRKKFGAIIGDNTEVGCNSVLNPGTVLGRNTNVYPLSMVRGYVPENSIYKQQGEICEKDLYR
ncbi:MAG: UDP-N-acetylglucosamine pyrophosphorylase [Clostridia bacterium]|nr:UDP-N-acetylglucosamine pyrophosphorylase [Clostridia bacterium]